MSRYQVCATVLIAVGGFICEPANGQTQSRLFGVRNPRLEEIDMATGLPLAGWMYGGGGAFHTRLTFHQGRFISINAVSCTCGPQRVTTFHPADGVRSEVPLTGVGALDAIRSLASDPTTGTLYFASKLVLYTLDPSTGQATTVAPFNGSPYNWEFIHAIGIDEAGMAYAIGSHDGALRTAVYTLELSTARLTWIGEIVMPAGSGDFFDIAIEPGGDWWASYWDAGIVPALRGLWRIDPVTFHPTFVRNIDPPYHGLAFLPPTQQVNYCTSKTDSLGCAPAIAGEGVPSPTASSGYTIRATNVRSGAPGALHISVGNRVALPFAGGSLCVAAPLRRSPTAPASSSGAPTPSCAGIWELDFNTWMSQTTPLPSGVTVRAQWLGRDGGFGPPDNWSLSDALEFTLRP